MKNESRMDSVWQLLSYSKCKNLPNESRKITKVSETELNFNMSDTERNNRLVQVILRANINATETAGLNTKSLSPNQGH